MQDLFQLGVDHLSAPIHYRERLAAACAGGAERILAELRREAALDEVAVLSTCSRFEIYARSSQPQPCRALARGWFSRKLGGASGCLVSRDGPDALRHLFRVAAGLDSWILGESEILGQVKKAYQDAQGGGFTGPWLNRIFQSALAAGKAARAKTGIQNGIHSIGGAAALLAQRIFGEEGRGQAVVFGAGQAAEAVCRHLAAKNFKDVVVANRTIERAEELAGKVGGLAVDFERGLELLAQAEVGVFSTSCSRPVLRRDWLRARMAGRGKPLFLIDLGLPRNVAPDCASLSDVFVYDLDDLKNVVAESVARKAPAKEEAQEVVSQAARECARQLEKRGLRSAEEVLS